MTLAGLGYPRTDMDKIITESYFGVGGSPTMRDMATATVNAAALLFPAGPHAGVFREKFRNQLILPRPTLPDPLFVFPAGGEKFTTGAVVQVQWDRQGAPAVAAARLEYSAGNPATFSDNMESGINGWTVSHASGSLNWSQVTTASHTPTHSWFATDQTTVSDRYLTSPLITVSAGAELSFWHSYNLESGSSGYDGGVVEISTNGTSWVDLGTSSTQNGYNSTISTSYSSPIGGRQAFSGNSGGFIETRISLAAYGGKSVYIRFREANDSSAAATGWWVDDVSVIQQWVAIGTTPTNAVSYLWTLPTTPGNNYRVRIQQFAAGYSDSAWVQSAPFIITTNAVNNPPTLDAISSLIINEDAATTNITLTGIGPGPDSGQTATNITATSSNPGLIPNPAVGYTPGNTTGTLSIAPVANTNGTATITVTVKDDGGTANGGVDSRTNTFAVTVNASEVLTVLGIIARSDGNMNLTFGGGRPGSNYVVRATADLVPTVVWTNLATNAAGPSGQWIFGDLRATNYSSRFYRWAKP